MHVILHEDRAATVSNNGNDTYMVNAAHPYPGRLEYERGGEVEYPPGKRDHSRILQCLGLRDLENAFCDYAIASKKVRETHTTTRTHTHRHNSLPEYCPFQKGSYSQSAVWERWERTSTCARGPQKCNNGVLGARVSHRLMNRPPITTNHISSRRMSNKLEKRREHRC